MDFELYEKIRNTSCKLHKLIEIKNSNEIININRDEYIITLKTNPFLKQFNSYSQFRENFLKIFKNIDCYKITNFIVINNLYMSIEIANIIEEDDFEDLKNDDNSFLILSGVILMDLDKEKSIIKILTVKEQVQNPSNFIKYTLGCDIKKTYMITIESYNNLYNVSIGEDIKIENIEIL